MNPVPCSTFLKLKSDILYVSLYMIGVDLLRLVFDGLSSM